MADPARARRLAKRVRTLVASAVELEIPDPRLELVTFTDAKMTADLREVTLYYTVRGASITDEPDTAGAAEAFAEVAGQLRGLVGARLGVKFTPSLKFELDTVPDTVAQMEELVRKAREADEAARKVAAGARPAGDENPYREEALDEEH
ncbi:ribosome-binding factor A [Segniliparus rugosus]|uniref:Ribosome-binding factor A n=1 Tax=Segniliparus rugosus (strain ATCC BAA-974 / DSM 45345 / CCUG 50838 / CIP 108380 / JCM 13579 / CDC 945) TaxID=679197 RepID=E5XSU9_SEGRC|nr:ribosome-binding factor A [Segniliparus rugosus]EFV12565.1 ribosome-binding factor A [Segniliparus rugosus ATCC BAA-974]